MAIFDHCATYSQKRCAQLRKHQPPPHFGVHVAQCVALFCCCFWDFVDNTKIGPWLNNTQFIVLWLQELSKQHIFLQFFFLPEKKIELKKKSCHSAVGKLFIVSWWLELVNESCDRKDDWFQDMLSVLNTECFHKLHLSVYSKCNLIWFYTDMFSIFYQCFVYFITKHLNSKYISIIFILTKWVSFYLSRVLNLSALKKCWFFS